MAFTRSPVRSRSGPPTFIPGSDFPQVVEGRCGCAGSNKANSVERDSVWKEQLLEPLPLFERGLHPQVGGARRVRATQLMPAYGEQIQESAYSRRDVDFAFTSIHPRNGNFANDEVCAARKKKNFDIEPKSIELLERKQQLR